MQDQTVAPGYRERLEGLLNTLEAGAVEGQHLRQFYDRLDPLVRRVLMPRLEDHSKELEAAVRQDRQSETAFAYVPLPDLPAEAVEHVRYFFARMVKYVGPLRDDPKFVYPLAPGPDPRDIGIRGEHTAAVLDLHRDESIEYVPPSRFEEGQQGTGAERARLLPAVAAWLQYMGVAGTVATADMGSFGHQIRVAMANDAPLHDLPHVGVGVSQVLPILVQALLAEPGSTLLFEQPELHLHPRVQTRLADFFLAMTMLGKQCIVETHSEYLINRLRYRAAVSKDDFISMNTLIYFVERTTGKSSYWPIRIDRYGVIDDWPQGFFDEGEDIAAGILSAAMSKRKREQGSA